MIARIAAGTHHAAQIEVVGPVFGVATAAPAVGVPAATAIVVTIGGGVGPEESNARRRTQRDVETKLATTTIKVCSASAGGSRIAAATETAHPNIHTGLVGLL